MHVFILLKSELNSRGHLKSGAIMRMLNILVLSKSVLYLLNSILFYKIRSTFTFCTVNTLSISFVRYSSNFWKTFLDMSCFFFQTPTMFLAFFIISVNKILYKELKICVQGLKALCVMMTFKKTHSGLKFILNCFPQ